MAAKSGKAKAIRHAIAIIAIIALGIVLWHAPSVSLFVFFACIGGAFVGFGLFAEQIADKEIFQNLEQYRRLKKVKHIGEWFVIYGVLFEVVTAGVSAANDWKNAPSNWPVSDISATVQIEFRRDLSVPTGVPDATTFELLESNEATVVTSLGQFKELDATSADPFRHEEKGVVTCQGLYVKFSPFFLNASDASNANLTPKMILKDFPLIRVHVQYLPKDAEIIGGKARILINGTIAKSWTIPAQKSDPFWEARNPRDDRFTLLATNFDANPGP